MKYLAYSAVKRERAKARAEVARLTDELDLHKRLLAQRDSENVEIFGAAVKIETERNELKREVARLRAAAERLAEAIRTHKCTSCIVCFAALAEWNEKTS